MDASTAARHARRSRVQGIRRSLRQAVEIADAVDLDSDRNGQTDLRVAVMHLRQSGAAEITTGDILSETQEDLWTIAGAGSSTSGSIDATLTGNTFTLEVDVAEDPGLDLVTERGQSTWTTFHKFGARLADQCEDRRN